MSRRILNSQANVCQLCDFLLPRQTLTRSTYQPQRPLSFISTRALSTTRRKRAQASNPAPPFVLSNQNNATQNTKLAGQNVTPNPSTGSVASLENSWRLTKASCDRLLAQETIPSEEETIQALSSLWAIGNRLILDLSTLQLPNQISTLQPDPAKDLRRNAGLLKENISKTAYSIIKYPPVFISPQVLEIYVKIQTTLGKPKTLPEAFHLYANKPTPVQASASPIKYAKTNPNKVSNAIPLAVAEQALDSAIEAKELVTAMDIVESAYTTTAFLRAKFVRKLLLPTSLAVAAPFAAYVAASRLAMLQSSMDSEMATKVAFAGILAYTFFTGTIGVVAATTANDQMDRVTWAPGVALRERYMREEERAALDRIAGSWGFKESWRRGEEEGEDWEALREWIGLKGMILDRVELMEGME